jgi:hypothetical protein
MVTSLMLLGVGLLSFSPSTFVADQTPEPVAGDPRLPTATPGPTATPVPLNPASARPLPTPHDGIVASRIRIPAVGIDLPIVAGDLDYPGNVDFYPLCDVAMYVPEFVQPGEQGATYLYAHAQRGMFAPLLNASEVRDGEGLVGALIEVYTSDNKLHLYELYRVKRHATDLSLTEVPPGAHLLVLQTSEGPPGTVPKLQVAARPISVVEATETDANPEANPRVCLPD